jgi:hypothetical protein
MLFSRDLITVTLFVFAIVIAEVTLMVMEVSALSSSGEVENAVNISSSYIAFFRVAFSFLNTGTLAIGPENRKRSLYN